MERLLDMHTACRKLNTMLSQDPDSTASWNIDTCLAAWRQARKDRGVPRYAEAYHNYKLATEIGFVAALKNSRCHLPPTLEDESKEFHEQFHAGRRKIVDRCRDIKLSSAGTTPYKSVCSKQFPKPNIDALASALPATPFVMQIKAILVSEFSLKQYDKHKKEIWQVLKGPFYEVAADLSASYEAQEEDKARIDIILIKSGETPTGPDWTSRYNGSVSRLVSAIQTSKDTLPPTGVYILSKSRSRTNGFKTFYHIRLSSPDVDYEHLPSAKFSCADGSQLLVELMPPFYHAPPHLDKTHMMSPMQAPCSVHSVVAKLKEQSMDIMNPKKSKTHKRDLSSSFSSSSASSSAPPRTLTEFYVQSHYLTRMTPYLVWFRIKVLPQDAHTAGPPPQPLTLSFNLNRKRQYKIAGTIRKYLYQKSDADTVDPTARQRFLEEQLPMLLGRPLVRAEMKELLKLAPSASLKRTLHTAFMVVTLEGDTVLDDEFTGQLLVQMEKTGMSQLPPSSLVVVVVFRVFDEDVVRDGAELRTQIAKARVWLLALSMKYVGVMGVLDSVCADWGPASKSNPPNLFLFDQFQDSVVIELRFPGASLVFWPLFFAGEGALGHEEARRYFDRESPGPSRRNLRGYRRQYCQTTANVFRCPMADVGTVLTNLHPGDWRLASRLEGLDVQPAVFSSVSFAASADPELIRAGNKDSGEHRIHTTAWGRSLEPASWMVLSEAKHYYTVPKSTPREWRQVPNLQVNLRMPTAESVWGSDEAVYHHNGKKRYEVQGKPISLPAVVKSTIQILLGLSDSIKDYLSVCRNYPFTSKKPAPPPRLRRTQRQTRFMLLELDTLIAAVHLSHKFHTRVCAMNLSHGPAAGGRWTQKKGGQEECNMRNSSLFLSVWPRRRKGDQRLLPQSKLFPEIERFYPLTNVGVVYSPNVAVIRDVDPEYGTSGPLQSPARWPIISMVTVVATDLRFDQYSIGLTRQKIRSVLYACMHEGHEVIVLRAFGCNVLKKNPHVVADIYKDLLGNEFFGVFKCVGFSIAFEDDTSVEAFQDVFEMDVTSEVDISDMYSISV